MKTVTFDDMCRDIKDVLKIDLYEVRYPRVLIDPDLGEQLRQQFMMFQLLREGSSVEDSLAFVEKTKEFGFKEQNTGRMFNFWHFCLALMRDLKTDDASHTGECVIKRGMVDRNEKEDIGAVFCYPYIAKGGKFAAPVIDKILDHYGVDELRVTAEIGR